MGTFRQVWAALRRKSRGQYGLLAGCCFFSTLLITAYVCMMRSPTILSVLPVGGDSRKQVMMVFVLAAVGCAVFTTYAAGLFLRQRSRELGVFLLLGTPRRRLEATLCRELAALAAAACAAGAALGMPLVWGVWQLFRRTLVDSREMPLTFDPRSYLLALCFGLYVVIMLLLLGRRSVRRANLLEIVQESHRSEPIREVKRWYGPVGIVLLAAGCLAGYGMPSVFVRVFHWYAPGFVTAVFYLPALAGLYMVLLHTVVNGWRRRRYRDILTVSMMKFQGRQTVRNMLVMAVLVAGGFFASFYAPMLQSSARYSFDTRPVDFAYHGRADQDLPVRAEVDGLAADHGVEITFWAERTAAVLGCDGTDSIETENGLLGATYTTEYRRLVRSATFFSESDWNALTGRQVDLAPGTCANVLDDEGGSSYVSGGDVTLVTNPVTGRTLPVTPAEPLRFTMLLGSYVLDDGDYAAIAGGLTDVWQERWVFFNVADADASYPFARALFDEIVDRSGPEAAVGSYYDPVGAMLAAGAGEPYLFDPEAAAENGFETIDYGQRDTSAFRNYWKYMPQFRVLDRNDFDTTMAVYLMLFLFIAVVCFTAAAVIAFTRSMTIALTSARVYDDLRRLGAPNAFLYRSVRSQLAKVFYTPSLVGTLVIAAFYAMILGFNDGRFTAGELLAARSCLAVVAIVWALLYLLSRATRSAVCRTLRIRPES